MSYDCTQGVLVRAVQRDGELYKLSATRLILLQVLSADVTSKVALALRPRGNSRADAGKHRLGTVEGVQGVTLQFVALK